MDQQKIFVPGPIVNSTVEYSENMFADFQTNPPTDEHMDNRYYFESIGATLDLNRNLYQFTPRALQMLKAGYKEGKTLTINHDKGLYGGSTLGFGATVDAVVEDGKLYIASYISLNKTYPKGPFGTSEQLRDGILDGFINSVSQSSFALKAKCSVCNLPYPRGFRDYRNENICKHYRGQQVVVEKKGEKIVETVHVIVQEAEPVELSLVQMGADKSAKLTQKQINLSLGDFIDEERYNFLFGDNNQSNPSEPNNSDSGDNDLLPEPKNEPDSIPQSKNRGEPEMSQATIDALTSRAEAAEKELGTARVDLETVRGEKAVMESQAKALETQISSLEAEKTAMQTQIDSANNEKDRIFKELETANNSISEKDKEIGQLKQEAADNVIVIADGKAARKEHEEMYVKAYVMAMGDDCTTEDEELQAETAKSFSIDVLKKKTKGFYKSAGKNYPADGRNVTQSGAKPNNNEVDKNNDEDGSYPIGV